jgi:diacylglycerol kinase family enzyme
MPIKRSNTIELETGVTVSQIIEPDRRWVPVLVNRIAGPKHRRQDVDDLAAEIRRRGFQPELFDDPAALREVVGHPDRQPAARCIVAAGGDGTIAQVVNAERAVPLAILPLGNENLLARHLGIPRNVRVVADMICARTVGRLDLGRINERYFVLMTSAGFDASVIDRLHIGRRHHISRWTYACVIAGNLRRYDFPTVRIRIDDEDEWHTGCHFFAFNLPQYGLHIPICPRAFGEDGLLDVLLFRRRGIRAMLSYLASILARRHCDRNDVLYRCARTVRIESDERVAVQSDGDPAGPLPINLAVEPAALAVLVRAT